MDQVEDGPECLGVAAEGEADERLGGAELEPTEAMPMISAAEHTSGLNAQSAAEETHLPAKTPSKRRYDNILVIWCHSHYFRTLPGVVNVLQVLLSASALVCLTTSGRAEGGYLNLPLSWHLRVFVFTTVAGFLTSLLFLTCQVTLLVHMYPLSWSIINVLAYSFLGFMFLFGTSLVASALDFYQKLDGHISSLTVHQLIAAVVLGYLCMILFGAMAFRSYREWKGGGVKQPPKWEGVKVTTRAASV